MNAEPSTSGPSDSQTDSRGPLSLADAAQVVDALNDVIALDGSPSDKARRLLHSFQSLVGDDADVELVLQTDITRDPAPRVVERFFVGPTFDRIEPRPDAEVQALLDASAPATRRIIPDVLRTLRVPHVFHIGRDIPDANWFAGVRTRFLHPHGWDDLVIADWAAGEQQMVGLAVMHRGDMPPLGEQTKRLTSLMLRAVAPIVVREMFDAVRTPDDKSLLGRHLSQRQTDVLHLLLRGMSEKQVARDLGVSTHTVHTHVKRLYTEFGVNSRGELLALFVDERVVRMTA